MYAIRLTLKWKGLPDNTLYYYPQIILCYKDHNNYDIGWISVTPDLWPHLIPSIYTLCNITVTVGPHNQENQWGRISKISNHYQRAVTRYKSASIWTYEYLSYRQCNSLKFLTSNNSRPLASFNCFLYEVSEELVIIRFPLSIHVQTNM